MRDLEDDLDERIVQDWCERGEKPRCAHARALIGIENRAIRHNGDFAYLFGNVGGRVTCIQLLRFSKGVNRASNGARTGGRVSTKRDVVQYGTCSSQQRMEGPIHGQDHQSAQMTEVERRRVG